MHAQELDRNRLPRHIAIIMDGNGRWAAKRGLPRIEGHRSGENVVREVVEYCGELRIKHLTLYTFSAENWRRSQDEVSGLMSLLELVARREIDHLHERNVCFRVLGRLEDLPRSLQEQMHRGISLTRNNTGLNLNLALNYGGRAELVDAVRHVAEQVRLGILDPCDISEQTIAAHLYHPEMPDPDLIIRTGGEMRLSNFLLWQSAYSEFWVTPTLWPDFGRSGLDAAIRSFTERERRFGAVLEPVGR
jgi:undecaprenyl diphosphate synthase